MCRLFLLAMELFLPPNVPELWLHQNRILSLIFHKVLYINLMIQYTGLFVWRVRSHTHTSAHAQTYLCVLFVACIKSHIQLKRSCSIGYSSFNPSFYKRHLWIMWYISIFSVSHALVTSARMPPKTEGQFYRAFSFVFFLELPKLILYTCTCTILNVKFLPFV